MNGENAPTPHACGADVGKGTDMSISENVIEGRAFDEERALYGARNLAVRDCRFAGPAGGESFLKESADIEVVRCFCDLRYPFWHTSRLVVEDSELTEKCRAALWYADHVDARSTKLHGIKALRECRDVSIAGCDIDSPEFGWSTEHCRMADTTARSEYFMLHGSYLELENVRFTGKYSFQYVRQAELKNCVLDTKDAFWHADNVTLVNCDVKGEYLGWYSNHLTLVNCRISGTQPFCYCTNLTLIDCEMNGCDLAFEKSDVEAVVTTPIDSVKNPLRGSIRAPRIGEIVLDEPTACRIEETGSRSMAAAS